MHQTKTCVINLKISCSWGEQEYKFLISSKVISYTIDEVCKAIVTFLAGTYLKFRSCQKDQKSIKKNFKEKRSFLHCIGVVHDKPTEIIECGMGSQCYSYKDANSIILLLVAGSNYNVIWADVGMNGRISNSRVLQRNKLGQMQEEGLLNLPVPGPLPVRSVPTPDVFIGDVAFALQPKFVKRFSRKNLILFTRICYYRFLRARQIFVIKTNLWEIFRSPISLHPKKVRELTMTALTLHNWLRSGQSKTVYMPPEFCDTYDLTIQSFIPGSYRKRNNHNCLIQLQPLQHENNPSVVAKKIREEFRE